MPGDEMNLKAIYGVLKLHAQTFSRYFVLLRRKPVIALRALRLPSGRTTVLLFAAYYVAMLVASGTIVSIILDMGWDSRRVIIRTALLFAGTVMAASFLLTLEFWKAISPFFGFLSAIAAIASFPYWEWYVSATGLEVNGEFLSTVAQVTPVLFIAVTIDLRRKTSDSTIRNLVLYAMVIGLGEFLCLFGLAFDVATSVFPEVASAFVGGFVGLIVSILSRGAR